MLISFPLSPDYENLVVMHSLPLSLQELNLMQVHKDQVQEMRRRHLSNTIELQYQQLRSLHEMRTEHLTRQHASEWDNQLSYSKKRERELRKKHFLELKEHPKSLKVCAWNVAPYSVVVEQKMCAWNVASCGVRPISHKGQVGGHYLE